MSKQTKNLPTTTTTPMTVPTAKPVETIVSPTPLTRGTKGITDTPSHKVTKYVSYLGVTFSPWESPVMYLGTRQVTRWGCWAGLDNDASGDYGACAQIAPDPTGNGACAMLGYRNAAQPRRNHPDGTAQGLARARAITTLPPGILTLAVTPELLALLDRNPNVPGVKGVRAMCAIHGETRKGGKLDMTGPGGNDGPGGK